MDRLVYFTNWHATWVDETEEQPITEEEKIRWSCLWNDLSDMPALESVVITEDAKAEALERVWWETAD